jgi:hypothetical protein
MKHVVMFSGGVGSWAAARRVAERYGTDDLTLLFADTNMEDEDLYRFIQEAAADVGGKFVQVQDGRTPWQVFFDERFLGNSRIDPCSKILKRLLLDRWRNEQCDPADTIIHFGIDFGEIHRLKRMQARCAPWRYEAPLCDAPRFTKYRCLDWLAERGIKPPRLYEMGFPHNNCGGFCIKAGKAHFRLLLHKMPERYRFHEEREQAIRDYLGKDVSILRDTKGGNTKPLTLRDFRLRIEASEACPLFDDHEEEWGGCGCAIDAD